MIVSAPIKVSVKGSGDKWTVLSIKVRPPFRLANFSSQMKRITHNAFLNVGISTYKFSLKTQSNQIRPWILNWDAEFISVQVRVVLNLPPHQLSATFEAGKPCWMIPSEKSIQRRQSQLIPNNETESLKKFKFVGQAWPLRYLCSALWLTDWAIKLIRTNIPWKNEDVWCTQNTNWGSTWYIKLFVYFSITPWTTVN